MTDYSNYTVNPSPPPLPPPPPVYRHPNFSADNAHTEFVKYIFDNLEVLKILLERDEALSTMLHDMIEAARPERPSKSPTKIRPLPAPNPPTNRRPRWGDED